MPLNKCNNRRKKNDPFSTQPLPRSFYHPSPTKEANEKEAIRSPQRHLFEQELSLEDEKFVREGPSHTLVGNISHEDAAMMPGAIQEEDTVTSSQFEESSFSQRDTSTSTSRSINDVTSLTETSVMSPGDNIGDIVQGFDSLQRNCHQDNISKEAAGTDHGEPVLQRYIERFRNSAPKSREERLREKEDKLQFWWLASVGRSEFGEVEAEAGRTKSRQNREKELESNKNSKLTREALQVLDEETLLLQNKADRLLYKSDLSLTSSSMIVSTEGLGSSSSVGSASQFEDHPPFQPDFTQPLKRNLLKSFSKPMPKFTENKSQFIKQGGGSEDILTRWRLRRKMEEVHLGPPSAQSDKYPFARFPRHTELDARLQEFRKKILTQKALITREDIGFERQRMDLLLDETSQIEGTHTQETTSADRPSHESLPAKDPVLQRLHEITGSSDFRPEAKVSEKDSESLPCSSFPSTSHQLTCTNNSNFFRDEAKRIGAFSASTVALNKNNTASSDDDHLQGLDINSTQRSEVIVDSFASMVICNPKQSSFYLENPMVSKARENSMVSKARKVEGKEENKMAHLEDNNIPITQSLNSAAMGVSTVSVDELHVERKFKMKSLKQEDHKTERGVYENTAGHIKKPANKSMLRPNMENKHDDKHRRETVGEDVGTREFYQYLEAEKPISESDKRKIVVNDKINAVNKTELFKTQVKQNCAQVENISTALIKDKQGERLTETQIKHKKLASNGEEAKSKVLTDITNESYSTQARSKIYSDKVGNDAGTSPCTSKTRPSLKSSGTPQKKPLADQKFSPLPQTHPIQLAIGQTVADHLLDNSTCASSIDSWTSMFLQSPGQSQSTLGLASSPRGSQGADSPIVTSTPIGQKLVYPPELPDQDYHSDGEFSDDPLLEMLRRQRDQYLLQLSTIDKKLQLLDN